MKSDIRKKSVITFTNGKGYSFEKAIPNEPLDDISTALVKEELASAIIAFHNLGQIFIEHMRITECWEEFDIGTELNTVLAAFEEKYSASVLGRAELALHSNYQISYYKDNKLINSELIHRADSEGVVKANKILQVLMLLDNLGDVPTDEDGHLEHDWLAFSKGTSREDIWHSMEEKFDVTIGDLMYGKTVVEVLNDKEYGSVNTRIAHRNASLTKTMDKNQAKLDCNTGILHVSFKGIVRQFRLSDGDEGDYWGTMELPYGKFVDINFPYDDQASEPPDHVTAYPVTTDKDGWSDTDTSESNAITIPIVEVIGKYEHLSYKL